MTEAQCEVDASVPQLLDDVQPLWNHWRIIFNRIPRVSFLPVALDSATLVKNLIKKNTGSDRDIDGVTAAKHR